MVDLRPIFLINGLFLLILGVGMLFPALVDVAVDNPDWQVFAICSGIVMFVGGMLFLTNRGEDKELSIQQAFILTVSTWVVIPVFGALPFVYSDLALSYTDAFFEAMSGLSTTGSTVITGLDGAPPGILLWRALLQWFGGVGIIIMAVIILPFLRVGGMQLFKIGAFDTAEKVLPRAAQLGVAISLLYVGLTIICAAALWMAGMTVFEAVCHAFTTIATGGYSTSDGSIGHFDSALIDYIIVLFMIIGSMPFILYLKMVQGHSFVLWQDSQVRWFLSLLVLLIAIMTLWRWSDGNQNMIEVLRYTVFNVVSILTGTGFATTDYTAWGSMAVVFFFFIMFIGGCAGSTSCGIKIFRFQVMVTMVVAHLRKILRPNGIFLPRYNDRPISTDVMGSVISYLFLFLVCFLILALGLSLTGLDFITAISGAGTAMANVGPALGPTIGPTGTFQTLPDTAKWFLTMGMLLGRLELFAVLILFSPQFWRA
ncbi:potassium transporter TrkH [Paremcibacter congregatus]|uniref:Trk system potassium uptake protein n=2 Tax=Paremcibacter congregatus TaxID=2043170 RepID=A0A2G4YUM4_9PROT|nr:potassium transporter TrkH [Paremcibacter congregatus]QDE26915.1 TrkH family potassium uptake protein [Paremcibacter congregatus]